MRVALFFDGRNFYSGWRDAGDGQRLDFPRLSDWLLEQASGERMVGARYYTASDPSAASSDKLTSFLDMLDEQPGYFVTRLSRRGHAQECESCGESIRVHQDVEVTTTMVTDIIRLAAGGGFDRAVLISGDGAFVPALEAVRDMGIPVSIASWGGSGVSLRLRRSAYGHIDLVRGLRTFAHDQGRDEAKADALEDDLDAFDRALEVFEGELKIAEDRFSGGYVGLGYFVTKWRSPALDSSTEVRRRLLDALVDDGRIEIYDADDGAQAIRLLPET